MVMCEWDRAAVFDAMCFVDLHYVDLHYLRLICGRRLKT